MAYYPTVWRGRRAPTAWDGVFNARQGLDRVFDRFFFDSNDENGALRSWSPVTDIRESEDGVLVTLELPGLTAEDVTVTVENGILSISGEKKQEAEEGEADSNYHLVERRYGSFARTFRLPRGVNTDKVNAKFENGLLNIDIPKSAQAKKKEIAIK